MMRVAAVSLVLSIVGVTSARAQDPPPKIGPFVIDIRGVVPRFPADADLAASRDVTVAELPGRGLGIQIGAHVYPLRWRAMTFGVGGELVKSRSRRTPAEGQGAAVRATDEKFTSLTPQLSFNFGTGRGWSYISAGIARSTRSLIPAGRAPFPADSEKLKTINYGGGARWFAKTHVAFTFDVRFYAINPGSPYRTFPASPRTRLMVIGAGVSIK